MCPTGFFYQDQIANKTKNLDFVASNSPDKLKQLPYPDSKLRNSQCNYQVLKSSD